MEVKIKNLKEYKNLIDKAKVQFDALEKTLNKIDNFEFKARISQSR